MFISFCYVTHLSSSGNSSMHERQRHLSENKVTTRLGGNCLCRLHFNFLGRDLLIGNYNYFVCQTRSIKIPKMLLFCKGGRTYFLCPQIANPQISTFKSAKTIRSANHKSANNKKSGVCKSQIRELSQLRKVRKYIQIL